MVFCGIPSKGCERCRQRRIKCDQLPGGCGQCRRQSVQCSGYRSQLDLAFRDQSTEVTRKAKMKRKKSTGMSSEESSHLRRNWACKNNEPERNVNLATIGAPYRVSAEKGLLPEHGNAILGLRDFHSSFATHNFVINARFSNLRLDYVESYPVGDRPRVVQCLNYYIKFCGPNYIWREEVITTGSIQRFAGEFLQTSLAEPVFLEIVLAICQADFDLRCQLADHPSQAALKHHSRALSLLRKRLSLVTNSKDQLVLAVVIAMITYDMTTGDWESYEIHLGYLRQVVTFYGGTNTLGWQGWFAYAYTWAELRWANHMAYRMGVYKTDADMNRRIEHSLHPISTDMCFWVSKLPVGFHIMVKRKLIGTKVSEVLVGVADWMEQCRALDKSSMNLGELNKQGLGIAGKCAKIISSYCLSQTEHLVCIASMAYIISLIEGPAGHSRGLEDLTTNLELLDFQSLEEECRIWVATTVAAANDNFPTSLPNRWTLLDQIMELQKKRPEWLEAREAFRKFFWDERHAEKWKQCWDTAMGRRD